MIVDTGTPLRHVLGYLGIPPNQSTLRGGAVLRQVQISQDAVAGGAELTVHALAPGEQQSPQPCIRCAWCVEGCPTGVHPAGVLQAAQSEDLLLAEQYGIEGCIECGICSYVCPSQLPLLSGVRHLRGSDSPGEPGD
jgi:electron transport complex protein RnfC